MAKYSSGGPKLRDVRLWVKDIEKEYDVDVTLSVDLVGASTSDFTVYVVAHASFPGKGILQPWVLAHRVPVPLASPLPLVDRLFELVVLLSTHIDQHSQSKFWSRASQAETDAS